MTAGEQFEVVLRSEPGQAVPADVRLRQALKTLLRQWGFRAIKIKPVAKDTGE